jgi:SAM-dependent methyltransferase
MSADYQILIDYYEQCFEQHGAIPQGVDWPNAKDLATRLSVMLAVSFLDQEDTPIQLLDLGCGYGALLDHIKEQDLLERFTYKGIDLSEKMIQAAQKRHGSHYFQVKNILTNQLEQNSFDYVVMNGVFTEKRDLSQEQMEAFFFNMIQEAFKLCRKGMAFNVMNYHVDWYRDELFYLPLDKMFALIKQNLSRHIIFRADYGLYEYTVYVYKKPNNYAR